MRRIIKLTESDLTRIVRRVIMEQPQTPIVNDTKKLMKNLDVILHNKWEPTLGYTSMDCNEFMYATFASDGVNPEFKEYEKWLEKNGFNKEWNTSRLCFGPDAVPSKNLENIKNRMIKLGWYK